MHDQLVDGTGLKEILQTCSMVTTGVSALVAANQIRHTIYCVQAVLCSLYHKQVQAAKTDNSLLEPYDWLYEKAKSSIMCFYWKMVIDLEVQICIFVQS